MRRRRPSLAAAVVAATVVLWLGCMIGVGPAVAGRSLQLSSPDATTALARLPRFAADAELVVPFTKFETATRKGRLLFHPRNLSGVLDVAGLGRVTFPRRGVPLSMLDFDGGRLLVFFREMFSGRLFLYVVEGSGSREIGIEPYGDAEPIFRAAAVHAGRLYTVLYDNIARINNVVAFDIGQADGPPIARQIRSLPTLEEPAGRTYEMIPTIHLVTTSQGLWLAGGNLVVAIAGAVDGTTFRLPACVRAQDVESDGDDLVFLCTVRVEGQERRFATASLVIEPDAAAYTLIRWSPSAPVVETRLRNDEGLPVLLSGGRVEFARGARRIGEVLRRDLEANHASGVMEFGINNVEGRVAWSQVYFLDALLDIVELAASDDVGRLAFGPLVADAKQRLDLELHVLDQMVDQVGIATRGFTVRRQPAVFAVQTSRLLELYNRYRRRFPDGVPLAAAESLRASVLSLNGHIEEIAAAVAGGGEPRAGMSYLRWPKGSAFPFDGLNVPYNHQNEWAAAVLDTFGPQGPRDATEKRAYDAARDMVHQFVEAIAPNGALPESGVWPYWWGQARAGWTAESGISLNTSAYAGDKLTAWISFRSIDAHAVLAARGHVEGAASPSLRESVARLISRGLLHPSVAASLAEHEGIPLLAPTVALTYGRSSSPSDMRNAVWAAFSLARQGQSSTDPTGRK